MSESPTPEDFLDVAGFLLEDAANLAQYSASWSSREDARARSAVSRGYYSVFRELKLALLPRRVEWRNSPSRFPAQDIHRIMYDALYETLGASDALVLNFNQLRRLRTKCDYELGSVWDCEMAWDEVETAEEAIAQVRTLTPEQLDQLAHNVAMGKPRRG